MNDTQRDASKLDHAYFRALEEAFIRLRGAPLLLSPADWQVAREWRGRGVPIELVVRVMERIFERQAVQGDADKRRGIRSLRYFRTAVARSWNRILELGGGETESRDAQPVDIPARLERLAAALHNPGALLEETAGGRDLEGQAVAGAVARALEGVPERVLSLEGDASSVEGELQRLDRAVMARLREELDVGTLASLQESVEESLAGLSERLADDTRAETRELLLRRRLREELNLPVLSLFSSASDSGR